MSVLNKLKIVAVPPKRSLSVEQERRRKFIAKLQEQLKLIEAHNGGEAYRRTKFHWHTDEDGNRKRITRDVKLREWWSVDSNGAVQFALRYGAAPVELQKGKSAIEVAKLADLPAVIKELIGAVTAGELDEAVRLAMLSRTPKHRRRAA